MSSDWKDRSVPKTDLKFSYRRRAKDDLEDLISLWVASWREAMPKIDFQARRGWFQEHFDHLEANGFETVCAFDQMDLIGFVTLNPSTHELDQLAVKPSAWGGGVAAGLLAEAHKLSPEILMLDVNSDNPRAVRFYQREGFECIGSGTNAMSGLKTQRMRWTSSSQA